MLTGNSIFAGDSITVGLAPFVQVQGSKKTIAKGGMPTAWLLGQVRKAADAGDLNGFHNFVVLIGTNDIGGPRSADSIASDIRAIWGIAKSKGLRVYAQTIPPVKGYTGFKDYASTNAKRVAINEALRRAAGAGEADALVDLSSLMADPGDSERLAKPFDSGDHIHPRKDAHGKLLTALESGTPATPYPPVPSPPSPLPLMLLLVAGAAVYFSRR